MLVAQSDAGIGELATYGRPREQVVRKRTLGEQVKQDMARGIAREGQRTAGIAEPLVADFVSRVHGILPIERASRPTGA